MLYHAFVYCQSVRVHLTAGAFIGINVDCNLDAPCYDDACLGPGWLRDRAEASEGGGRKDCGRHGYKSVGESGL